MVFPKGEVRYQNLSASYTDLPALLKTMKSEGFSGTIEVEFPGSKGTIFIASGEIINAEVRKGVDSKRMFGQEALQDILSLSNQKEGVLSVYRLPSNRVAVMASTLQSDILFKDLSSDFIRLDRLILKLMEEKQNGFIEILTKEHKGMGVLFFQGGEVVELFATSESGASLVEKKTIPVFLENVVKQGVLFNVYRNQGKIPVKESPVKETPAKETRVKDPAAKEPPVKEAPAKETPAREVRVSETTAREATVKETVVPPAKEAPVKETPGAGGNEDLREVITIFEDILSRVEKVADSESRKGTFLKEFRRSLIEKSVEYPFLDPFAGEFEYQEGTISFKGEVGTQEFAKGIGESLQMTVNHLEVELQKNKMLTAMLMLEIESLLEYYREEMKRLGVDTVLHSIFQ
jgi:hypothetical protein